MTTVIVVGASPPVGLGAFIILSPETRALLEARLTALDPNGGTAQKWFAWGGVPVTGKWIEVRNGRGDVQRIEEFATPIEAKAVWGVTIAPWGEKIAAFPCAVLVYLKGEGREDNLK